MSRLGRYWLFFVIIAVGLALSWGQVGRKTGQVLEEQGMAWLVTESPCHPRRAPCAAVARDRAIVLGPGPAGAGLVLRQAGLGRSDIVRAEAIYFDRQGVVLDRRLLIADGEGWRLGPTPASVQRLRITLVGSSDSTAAEFQL